MVENNIMDTASKEYSDYYLQKYAKWWRFLSPVEIPFKFFARCLCKGKTLDVGCGPGRYLSFLPDATGIDHNPEFIFYARRRGFKVFLSQEFDEDFDKSLQRFDTLLFSHILEHMEFQQACEFVKKYLPTLKPGGKVIIIVPDGISFKNDPSHRCYFDCNLIKKLASANSLHLQKAMYHPFPKYMSRWLVNDAAYKLSFQA
jgi:SAM-dependent methyltransferase